MNDQIEHIDPEGKDAALADVTEMIDNNGGATLDQLITQAATYWDGCDEVQYQKEAVILEAQVEAIYEAQHQDWHDDLFEPDVLKHWIRTTIKNRALPFDRYLANLRKETVQA